MSDTTFVDGTVIEPAWLNDVNDFIYTSTQGVTGATPVTALSKANQVVSVKDFGATGDGTTNDTAAIQAAFDYAASLAVSIAPEGTAGDVEVVFPKGLYRVTTLSCGVRVHLRFAGGVLQPYDVVTSYTHLIKFLGHNIVNNATVWMNYATNYDCCFWVRARHVEFRTPEIWTAKCAFIFGDPAWEGVAASGSLGDSENAVIGGTCVWCITVAKFYGLNTIVNFTGGNYYSYNLSLSGGDPRKAAWEALTNVGFINCGAVVYITGAAIANFTGAQPVLQSNIQVTNTAGYENSYGKYHLSNTHIESGYLFACASAGATPIQDDSTTMLRMIGCNGYISSGRAGYLIDCGSSAQAVDIRSCNFYGNTLNSLVTGAAGKVHVDEGSFADMTTDFYQSLLIDKPTDYSSFLFLSANTTSQAFTAAASDLVLTATAACDFHASRVSTYYNAATGVFTAPVKMRNVILTVGLAVTGGALTDETDVRLVINGVNQGFKTLAVNGLFTFRIYKLDAGDTVKVQVVTVPNRTANGSASNYMYISGNC